jgi:sugar (pentulose or hexulose) kinase
MSSPDHILAIDQGTSATKAVLVDASGAIVARGSAPVSLLTPRPGWVEQDANAIWASVQAARETRGIVTAEEAIVTGGLGAAVASLVAQHEPTPMRILGISGFAPTGSASFLLDHFGLTADGIAAAAHELA